ncbi:MAG: hypothetical protein AB8B80_09515, partial [Marinicellaceae bacterium]
WFSRLIIRLVPILKNLLLLLLVCFSPMIFASDWELVKDKKGVAIYSLKKPSYKLKHFKAQVTINKDADTILAALQDTANCQQWVYNCLSNKMVDMIDFRKRVYHTIIESPLWFKDREFYLESDVIYNPTNKQFTVSFKSIPDYKKASKKIHRVKNIEMTWKLETISDNKTLVNYQVYIDPKFPIKPINHSLIKKSIFKTMQGLKEIANNPIYAETKYSKSELEMLAQ